MDIYEFTHLKNAGDTGEKKTVFIGGSKTIKKLSSKKTYYVQIRPYVKNAYGTKIYGSWSKKVKVKTK